MSGPKLYEIVDAYERVLAWIDENEEELVARGGELPADVVADLDEIEDSLTKKVEQVGLMVRTLAAYAKVAEEEAGRLRRRGKALGNASDGLKHYLLAHLQRAQGTATPKLRTPLVSVWGQRNSTYSVRPKDPSNIPVGYRRVRLEGTIPWKAWLALEAFLLGAPALRHEEELDKTAAHAAIDAAIAAEKIDLPLDQEIEVAGLVIKHGVQVRVQ